MNATAPPPLSSVTGAAMFTDIVGFTEYTAEQGDEFAIELLGLQERIVRDELPGDARVVKELGDGLLLWFPDPCQAVQTALALQRRFEDAAESEGLPLWVRIGIHWGRQTTRRDDIVGHDVNVASRVVNMAGPGEVLLSERTLEKIGGALAGVAFEELGPVVMKGIPGAVRLFRASAA